ncbi:MAG: hypothetical protein GEU74_16075 [Nitriliruptorales bacterium]|nr:hypothetical protein [Nitriliruptorales bacterium]
MLMLAAHRVGGDVSDADELAAVARWLGGEVLEFAALELAGDPDREPVAVAMQEVVSGPASAVPLFLRAAAAEGRGDAAGQLALLEAAVDADPGLTCALEDLAELCSVRGDAQAARRWYERAGVDSTYADYAVLRRFLKPADGDVGRNRPCPCGSGKKYKMCHGRDLRHPFPQRAGWPWAKLVTFALRPRQRDVVMEYAELLADDEGGALSAAFHDGTRVAAEHFVRTWSAAVRDGRAAHHLRDVAGYQAVRDGRADRLRGAVALDRTTLEVSLSRPVQDFPSMVAHPALAPMPEVSKSQLEHPVGNGAFGMAEPWARGRFVRLRRHRPAPTRRGIGAAVDEVVFRFQDETSAYIAYEQERVDVAPIPMGALSQSPPPATRVVPYRGPGVLLGPLPTTYFLWFNQAKSPFDRPAVRRAVSQAIDRSRLVREVFEGNASPGQGLAPGVVPGGRQRACRSCRFRPVAAERILRAHDVSRVTLWINAGGDHERIAARLRADLARVGVAVRVRSVPFERFLDVVTDGEAQLFRFGWTMDYPVLENALRPLFHSASTPGRGAGANYGGYASRRVDALLDRAAATPNHRRRVALLQRVEDIVLDRDQAIIPIVRLHRRTVVADRVLNLTYGPFGTADIEAVRVVRRVGNEP